MGYAKKIRMGVYAMIGMFYARIRQMAEAILQGKGFVLSKKIMQPYSKSGNKVELRSLICCVLGHKHHTYARFYIGLEFTGLRKEAELK